jgi:hypothetical protein
LCGVGIALMASSPSARRPNSAAVNHGSPASKVRNIYGANGGRVNGGHSVKPQPTSRSAVADHELDFHSSYTESNNFLEEFVNHAIRNYDRVVQRRLMDLEASAFKEIGALSARLMELEGAVANVKEEAASSSKVIDALVDLGKVTKLNNHKQAPKFTRACRTTPMSTLTEASFRDSKARSVRGGAIKHSPPHPGVSRRSAPPRVFVDDDALVDRQDEDDQANIISNGVVGRWNDGINTSLESERARSISPERAEDEGMSKAWTKFQELVSNMGYSITARMSNLEAELGECRSLFGQVSQAAERLSSAAGQQPLPLSTLQSSQHQPQYIQFPQSLPFIGMDGRPYSTNATENVYSVWPMFSSANSIPSSGYGKRVPAATNTLAQSTPVAVDQEVSLKPVDVGAVASSRTAGSVTTTKQNGQSLFNTDADVNKSTATVNDGSDKSAAIQEQISTLEVKLKAINKEKVKARKSIKVWVDTNTKEGQEPSDEQKEEAKRLFEQHVQVFHFSPLLSC